MKSERFTENDKMVIRGLCQQPWANDREIAEAEKLKMSTVTACKNRMKRDGVFKKAYFPVYYRLGYPLVSFSQLKMAKPSEVVLRALTKYRDNMPDKDNKSIVSFMVNDSLNAFVIAHHSEYTAFKDFEQTFDYNENWSHELYTVEGAIKVVNFDYTNTLNRLFFPNHTESYKPLTMKIDLCRFSKIEKKVFEGLLANPEAVSNRIAKKIGVTRQSVIKILRKLRMEGILEKNVVVDLGNIGIQIVSVIRFKAEKISNREISEINRILEPFFYWIFDNNHIIIVGHEKYGDLISNLRREWFNQLNIQLFSIQNSIV